MKKKFAIIYFIVLGVIVLTVLYSEYASQYPYQPTRSTQILAVIKKAVPKSANKSIDKNNVIVTKKAVNSSSQTQQIEESETLIEDAKKEEKTSPSSEKSVTEINSTDNKINSKQQVQEILPTQERFAEMNLANGVNFDERLEEEKKYKTDSVSEMKTQGHYIGLDVIGMQGKFSEDSSKIKKGKRINTSKATNTDNGGGVGLNYKYAFNFNDVFIAPGIFVEGLGMEINGSESANGSDAQYNAVSIKSRHGAFVDVGYDVNCYLSPYVMAGYSWVHYRTKNGYGNATTMQTALEQSMVGSGIYGAGLKLNYDKNVSFNIEINTQKFNTKTNTKVPLNTSAKQYIAVFPTRLNSLKLGIYYKF